MTVQINFNLESDFDQEVQNAPIADELNKVCESLVREENFTIVDKDIVRRNEDWSVVANQVVGFEHF